MLLNDKLLSNSEVNCFKIIRETLSVIGIEQSTLLPEHETVLICIERDVSLFLQLANIDGEYMIKVEEFEVKNQNKGLGTLIMYVITRICELFNVKVGLWTTPQNDVATKWYEKLGFCRMETMEHNNHTWWEKEPSINARAYYLNKINNLVDLMDSLIEIHCLHFYIKTKDGECRK